MTILDIIRLDAHVGANPQSLKIQHYSEEIRPIKGLWDTVVNPLVLTLFLLLFIVEVKPWKHDFLHPSFCEQVAINQLLGEGGLLVGQRSKNLGFYQFTHPMRWG